MSQKTGNEFEMIPDRFCVLPQVTQALRENGLRNCNLIIGIDFTKSNEWSGKYTFSRQNLHDDSCWNPYKEVIDTIGKTLRDFDEDNCIPCYGFGDTLTQDHSVFTFSTAPGLPFEEILSRYSQIVSHVQMAGPTSFAPIVHQAISIVNVTGMYHILVIIADGQVTRSVDTPSHLLSKNEQETVDAIRLASHFPLSIVMVGVGDGPWNAMRYFDDQLGERRFDNFQFVDFYKITSECKTLEQRQTQFALRALMEIPEQYRVINRLGYLGKGPNNYGKDVPFVMVYPSPDSKTEELNQTERLSVPSAPSLPVSNFQERQGSAESNFSTDELASLQEGLLCCICEERRKDIVFQCGHETCEVCANQLNECPNCREKIQIRIKRYL